MRPGSSLSNMIMQICHSRHFIAVILQWSKEHDYVIQFNTKKIYSYIYPKLYQILGVHQFFFDQVSIDAINSQKKSQLAVEPHRMWENYTLDPGQTPLSHSTEARQWSDTHGIHQFNTMSQHSRRLILIILNRDCIKGEFFSFGT